MLILTEEFLAKIAGWEAMKMARALLGTGGVLSSNWTPPVLLGVVREGSATYRAGLVIKDAIDIENTCSCRDSRQWGKMCAHSVGVGLHHLRSLHSTPAPSAPARKPAEKTPSPRRLQRAASGEQEVPVQLRLILPPNLDEAVSRNKIMVCVEAERGALRSPLNSLPQGEAYWLGHQDGLLLDRLEEWAGGETPGLILLTLPQLGLLLDLLPGHPGVTLGRSQALEISSENARLELKADLEAGGQITVRLMAPQSKPLFAAGKKAWRRDGARLCAAVVPESLKGLWMNGTVTLPRLEIPLFLNRDWAGLGRDHSVEAGFSAEDFSFSLEPARIELQLEGGLAGLDGALSFRYGSQVFAAGSSSAAPMWFPDEANPLRYGMRDLAAEQTALGRLLRAGFSSPDGEGLLRLRGQENVLNFFARVFPGLKADWRVELEERLEFSRQKNIETIRPKFRATASGEQWFDLEVAFETESGQQFSASDIQTLLRSGQSHSRMRNGRFAVLDTGAVEDFQEALSDCRPFQQGTAYRIGRDQAGFLAETVAAQPAWKLTGDQAWREHLSGLDPSHAPPPDLGPLEGVLRPYQKQGVVWLRWLRRAGFGGVLADEMGLGKTLQTLAFLETARRENPGAPRRPSLVICPTSLICNWLKETSRFTPSLSALDLTGPGRAERFPEAAAHDLLVTSYALLRRDLEFYRGLELDTVVLDEAQHIKNRETQNARAVKALRASQRLVLTGTPMENSVLDLWSIFDFLMPGHLGTADDFRDRYELPIVKENSAEARRRLARRLRPFLLRRLKKEVAADLPARIDQVSYCELSEEQQTLYRQVLEAARREVTESVEASGFNQARMLVFTALLRLRQVCCDPRLLKLPGVEFAAPSAKVELFGELLQEVLDGGHRVLVFSQFTGMLKLLGDRLTGDGVEYCYLDGSTRNRGDVVESFQSSDKYPVFLISLKAGGTGLNLTGADTVIHFDPWWNPAVEEQATDRAHRIGQSRVVTSYKLIARGTVEEKILHLQARKKALIQGVIDGEEAFAGALGWEEVQELLGD
jgi:superfamily II DNA or RNA helicase